MRKQVILLLLAIPFYSIAQKDTFRVYFNSGSPKLTEAGMRSIDSLVYHQLLNPGKKVGIIGFADEIGTTESNILLSQSRADAVRQYLLQSGFKPDNIQTVTGKGEVSRNMAEAKGYRWDRKVEIIKSGLTVFQEQPQKQPRKVDLSKLNKNETALLENINFHPGSPKILPQSLSSLELLLMFMKSLPSVKIGIEGHICCDVDPGYSLSTARAKTVYDYLINNGIDSNRLQYKGLGRTKPLVYPEKTAEEQRRNRRVEIRILEK